VEGLWRTPGAAQDGAALGGGDDQRGEPPGVAVQQRGATRRGTSGRRAVIARRRSHARAEVVAAVAAGLLGRLGLGNPLGGIHSTLLDSAVAREVHAWPPAAPC
jgi:hypothetical protein